MSKRAFSHTSINTTISCEQFMRMLQENLNIAKEIRFPRNTPVINLFVSQNLVYHGEDCIVENKTYSLHFSRRSMFVCAHSDTTHIAQIDGSRAYLSNAFGNVQIFVESTVMQAAAAAAVTAAKGKLDLL